MQYKRIMGIDYGEVRIGIALSDLLCIISSPYEVYKSRGFWEDIKYITNLAKEKEVDRFVVGLPLQMDGEEGDRAIKTREFGEALRKESNLDVIYQDERLTSVEAEEILIKGGVRREQRKELIDKISAQIILQSYLEGRK